LSSLAVDRAEIRRGLVVPRLCCAERLKCQFSHQVRGMYLPDWSDTLEQCYLPPACDVARQ
jgi:hypothetical protein